MKLFQFLKKKKLSLIRICLIPFWGEGNLGDEAMLTASIGHLLRKHPRAVIRAVAISKSGCYPVWCFSKSESKQRQQIRNIFSQSELDKKNLLQKIVSVRSLFHVLKNSDLTVFNGGLWFHDYKLYSMLLPLFITVLARLLGTKVVFLGVSAGPIRYKWSKFLGYLTISLAAKFSVRDLSSKEQLQQCCSDHIIRLASDPCFTLNTIHSKNISTIVLKENFNLIPNRFNVGINIFPWFNFANYYAKHKKLFIFEQCLVKYCRYLVDDFDAFLVFIPTQIPLDTEASLKIANQCCRPDRIKVLKGHYFPEDYIQLIKELDMMLAMRLHAHIFSIIAGTPFLSISYHSKISSMMELVKEKQLTVDSDDLNIKKLQDMTQTIISSTREIRANLDKAYHRLREAALSDNHQLDMLIDKEG